MYSQTSSNEEDISGGLQIICCPINRVVSDVRPLPPSTAPLPLEDHVSSNISKGNISLGRKPSRVSVADQQPSVDEQVGTETEGADADAEQVLEVQKSRSVLSSLFRKSSHAAEQPFVEEHSVVTEGADADAEQVLEVQKSRSVLSSLFRKSSHAAEQPFVEEQAITGGADADADADAGQVLEVQKSRSVLSQSGLEIRVREDGVAVEPSCSQSDLSQNVVEKPQSMYNNNTQSGSASVQGPSIHAGEGDINVADVPYGHAYYEPRPSMGRDRKKWGLGLVSVCVFVGLCATLIVLSANTQRSRVEVEQNMNRYGLTGDYDGDGISNGLEIELGLDPFNADSDGDGVSDGEEFELLLKEQGASGLVMMTKGSKAPGSKAPKATNPPASKAPKLRT